MGTSNISYEGIYRAVSPLNMKNAESERIETHNIGIVGIYEIQTLKVSTSGWPGRTGSRTPGSTSWWTK